MSDQTTKSLEWKVNSGQLLKEILNNPNTAILTSPLKIFSGILAEVGQRASELNDPKLNALMCRLAIYSISDPFSGEYDSKLTNEIIEKGKDPDLIDIINENEKP